jgi:hypothetical protein
MNLSTVDALVLSENVGHTILIVQNYVEQRAVNLQAACFAAGVVNET